MAGDRTDRQRTGTLGRSRLPGRRGGAAAVAALLSAVLLAGGQAGSVVAQGFPLRIDCPDAPLYAAGGLTLVRDLEAQGLVLSARIGHNRMPESYDISCRTEAAPAAAQGTPPAAAKDRSSYLFVCTAHAAGRSTGGAQASWLGSVPAGVGLDHPDTQASIAAAICPAARLALARFRADGEPQGRR